MPKLGRTPPTRPQPQAGRPPSPPHITPKVDDERVLAMAYTVPIDQIQPDPDQPRTAFPDETLGELAASIKDHGVLQPLLVREDGLLHDGRARYTIVAGGRRYAAALRVRNDPILTPEQRARGSRLPVVVRPLEDETTTRVLQLIENLQREDLNVVDRAAALTHLKVNLGTPNGKPARWDDVAELVGVSKRRVLQLAAVADLDEAPQKAILSGTLTEKHTRGMNDMTPAQQADLTIVTVAQELTPDETMRAAREMKRDSAIGASEAVARTKAAKTPVKRPKDDPGTSHPTTRGGTVAPPVERAQEAPVVELVATPSAQATVRALATAVEAGELRAYTDARKAKDARYRIADDPYVAGFIAALAAMQRAVDG